MVISRDWDEDDVHGTAEIQEQPVVLFAVTAYAERRAVAADGHLVEGSRLTVHRFGRNGCGLGPRRAFVDGMKEVTTF